MRRPTGEAVEPGVMTISDEGRAADFFTDLDAELGYRFIADEPDHRCNDYRPKILYRLWMKETINGLVAGNNGAKQNHEYDGHPARSSTRP